MDRIGSLDQSAAPFTFPYSASNKFARLRGNYVEGKATVNIIPMLKTRLITDHERSYLDPH